MWKLKALLSRDIPARVTHLSDRRRVSQPGCGYGQPLPRRVCRCDAQSQMKHVLSGRSVPTLVDPSVAA